MGNIGKLTHGLGPRGWHCQALDKVYTKTMDTMVVASTGPRFQSSRASPAPILSRSISMFLGLVIYACENEGKKGRTFRNKDPTHTHTHRTHMVTDRILEMEKRFDMGKQTTAARRGRIFP